MAEIDVIDAAVGDRRSPWVVVAATLDAHGQPSPIDLAGKTVRFSLSRDGSPLESSLASPAIEVEPQTDIEIDRVRGLLRVSDPAKREQSPPAGVLVKISGTSLPQGLSTADRYSVVPERLGWFALRSLASGQIVRPKTDGSGVKVAVVGAVSYRPSQTAVGVAGELTGVILVEDGDGRSSSLPARAGFRVRVSAPLG